MAIPTCVGAGRDGRKEEQIARRQLLAALHRFPLFKLLSDFARQRHAVLGEHVLRKSAAIESLGIGAAVPVWHPAKRQRRADEGVAVHSRGLRRRGRLDPAATFDSRHCRDSRHAGERKRPRNSVAARGAGACQSGHGKGQRGTKQHRLAHTSQYYRHERPLTPIFRAVTAALS